MTSAALLILAAAATVSAAEPPSPPPGISYQQLGDNFWRFDKPDRRPSWWRVVFDLFGYQLPGAPPFGRSVAFLAGVSEYSKPFESLPFVKTDLTNLRNYLLQSGGFDTVFELRDNAVNAQVITDYMVNKFSSVDSSYLGAEDRLLFYYSGHGGDKSGKIGYLLFSKAKPNDYTDALSINQFRDWSQINVAKHLLVILDACASGLVHNGKDGPSPEAFVKAMSGEGSGYILTAGTGSEKAYEVTRPDHKQGYSVFTRAILDSLERGAGATDKSGFLTIEEVMANARKGVAQFAADQRLRMTPKMSTLTRRDGVLEGTFVFLNRTIQKPELPAQYAGVLKKSKGEVADLGPTASRLQLVQEAFDLVKNSSDLDELRAFVKDYENVEGVSTFVVRIKNRIKQLEVPPTSPTGPRIAELQGLKYVWIEPGTFTMGCSTSPKDQQCNLDESPPHQVHISKGFWMGQTPVTVAAYEAYRGRRTPQPTALSSAADNPQLPAVGVTWDDANSYCEWAGMRLPTEAEWEYAARAGTTGAHYGPIDNIAWHSNNSDRQLRQVATKQPNPWGLYDMLGNVWQWVSDWYDEKGCGSHAGQIAMDVLKHTARV